MPRRTDSRFAGVRARAAGLLALLLTACRGRDAAPAPALPAADVIAQRGDSLLAIPGVVGLYEGRSHGETVIRVMLAAKADSTLRRIPRRLAGYRVEIEVGGPVEPMHR